MAQPFNFQEQAERSIDSKVELPYSSETPILLVNLESVKLSATVRKGANRKPGVPAPAKGEKLTPEQVDSKDVLYWINMYFTQGDVYGTNVSNLLNTEYLNISTDLLRKTYAAITNGKDLMKDVLAVWDEKEGGYKVTVNGVAVKAVAKELQDVVRIMADTVNAVVAEHPAQVWLKLCRDDSKGGRPNQLVFGKGNFIAAASDEIPEKMAVYPAERFDTVAVDKTAASATPAAAVTGTPGTIASPFKRN